VRAYVGEVDERHDGVELLRAEVESPRGHTFGTDQVDRIREPRECLVRSLYFR
jgi:hypothetical protein